MKKRLIIKGEDQITIQRDAYGVPHVEARSETDLYFGMGYCHMMDRGVQVLLMRLLGRGQISEHLDASDESLAIDLFFRRMNWSGHVEGMVEALPARARAICEAYTAGINARMTKKVPWEFKLVGYRPVPWTVGDSVMLSRFIGYISLAQSQYEIERLIVELVQAGTDRAALEELFPGLLGELDEDLVRKVTLGERIVPEGLGWNSAIPRMMASNNWVVAGSRTQSGKPIMANDPHLEVNRLPNVWQELVLKKGDRWAISATMPGLPGLLLTRTPDLAWGATYTFMDAVDSWIEHCRDGRYRREAQWVPFEQRTEVIKRKKKPDHVVTFYENDHGVLEGDPTHGGDSAQESYLLATRWASGRSGAESLAAIAEMWDARTVEQGMALMGRLETAWNWVLADREGGIGYQMSGLMPRRRPGVSGLVPLPGWDPKNDWQGFVPASELPRVMNPAEGFFVTANQDLNEHGQAKPINAPMTPYRAERIQELLAGKEQITVEDCLTFQYDLYSRQAEVFMAVLGPLLPDTPQGRLLKDWDLKYDPDSKGAALFERVYRALLCGVFGRGGVGGEVMEHLLAETGIIVDFALNFDRILLSESSRWFGGQARDELYTSLIAEALTETPQAYGKGQQIMLSHILFGGKMPRFIGFDRGPIVVKGGRATPHQGQVYRSAGRDTSFAPSFRIITDLATQECHTNLVGGPVDRRFSRWYCSEVQAWLEGRCKVLKP